MDIPESDNLLKRNERLKLHINMITSIAMAATEPGDTNSFILRTLEIICRVNDWCLGQHWRVITSYEVIVCTDNYFASVSIPDFRNECEERRFSLGVGLPGQVWATGQPGCIPNTKLESDFVFRRKESALASGVKSLMAMPIKHGPFVQGVFEFASFKETELTDDDLVFFEKLGIYIGTLVFQKDSEAVTRKEQISNRTILNHATEAFVALNETSLIAEWSNPAIALFGWQREEVIGKPIFDLIIPERYKEAHLAGFLKYLSTGKGPVINKTIEAPALTKDGTEIKIQIRIFPVGSLESKRVGAFITKLNPATPSEIVLS